MHGQAGTTRSRTGKVQAGASKDSPQRPGRPGPAHSKGILLVAFEKLMTELDIPPSDLAQRFLVRSMLTEAQKSRTGWLFTFMSDKDDVVIRSFTSVKKAADHVRNGLQRLVESST